MLSPRTQKRKREETRLNERKRHLIQRSDTLYAPSATQVNIRDELGCTTRSKIRDTRSEAYVRSLQPTLSIDLSQAVLSTHPYRQYTIGCFDYDRGTQAILLGATFQNADALYSILPDRSAVYPSDRDEEDGRSTSDQAAGQSTSYPRRPHYSYPDLRLVAAHQSPISSINLNSKTRTLVTTSTGGAYAPTVQISQLVDPCRAVPSQPMDSGISTVFRPPNTSTIFTSRLNPWLVDSQYEHIAVGSSQGIIGIFGRSDATRNWRCMPAYPTDSDVLAMDWLSPSLLAAGQRDSSVVLYDMRVRDGVNRMRHGSSILNLRRADGESRFVCAGVQGRMALYDLRMLRDSKVPVEPANKGPRKISANPLVKLKYINQLESLGMDISEELGLVAAAEEKGYIRISSLRTGESIRRFYLPAITVSRGSEFGGLDDAIKCVRFVEDCKGVPKLMASWGPRLFECVW